LPTLRLQDESYKIEGRIKISGFCGFPIELPRNTEGFPTPCILILFVLMEKAPWHK
jgi:hypothetical protein